MDRLINPALLRRRTIRRVVVPSAMAIIGMALVMLLTGWLRPSIRHDRVRTATVERNDVSATLDASGLVVPEFEQILTAPLATRVVSILKTPGSEVAPGDPIVLLDDKDARRDVSRLQEQIALKENTRRQTDLELARSRNDLASQREVKALELTSFQYQLERNRMMFEKALIIADDVRKSETDVARANIELRHLDTLLANAEEDLAARLEGLALEITILEKDLERARERLARTSVTSDRAGIVTWVVTSEGAAAAEGETVARVADLSAYRVDESPDPAAKPARGRPCSHRAAYGRAVLEEGSATQRGRPRLGLCRARRTSGANADHDRAFQLRVLRDHGGAGRG
jgi:HlyD family secretion protein